MPLHEVILEEMFFGFRSWESWGLGGGNFLIQFKHVQY